MVAESGTVLVPRIPSNFLTLFTKPDYESKHLQLESKKAKGF